jgi:hypothetical protein
VTEAEKMTTEAEKTADAVQFYLGQVYVALAAEEGCPGFWASAFIVTTPRQPPDLIRRGLSMIHWGSPDGQWGTFRVPSNERLPGEASSHRTRASLSSSCT